MAGRCAHTANAGFTVFLLRCDWYPIYLQWQQHKPYGTQNTNATSPPPKRKKEYKKKIWATSSGGGYRLEIYFRYSVDKIANRQKIAVNIHYFQYNIFLFYTGAWHGCDIQRITWGVTLKCLNWNWAFRLTVWTEQENLQSLVLTKKKKEAVATFSLSFTHRRHEDA